MINGSVNNFLKALRRWYKAPKKYQPNFVRKPLGPKKNLLHSWFKHTELLFHCFKLLFHISNFLF